MLGRGGMGVVYQAVQERLQRVVALKILPPTLAHNDRAIARFTKEAHTVARLNHPNVVGAFDYGESHGQLYLALEFVEGTDCSRAIAEHGAFSEAEALRVIREAILGLRHALSCGVIHRDIKPANLMLPASTGVDGPVVKVCDLGLAQLVADSENAAGGRPGLVVGTPCYMAPEQALGDAVDFRADIYGLGATLYQMVTGKRPFQSDSVAETLRFQQVGRLPHPRDERPDLSAGLTAVIDGMLARSRDARYSSYDALLADIEALMEGRRIHPPRVRFRESSLRKPKSRRSFWKMTRTALEFIAKRPLPTPKDNVPAMLLVRTLYLTAAVLVGLLFG
jgi:serine/threonine-protein kinase